MVSRDCTDRCGAPRKVHEDRSAFTRWLRSAEGDGIRDAPDELAGTRADADGEWMFIATCDNCGCQSPVDPAEVLTHPRTHPACAWQNSRSACAARDCRRRTARIDPIACLRTHACVAGMM